jgi:hypothetical protein
MSSKYSKKRRTFLSDWKWTELRICCDHLWSRKHQQTASRLRQISQIIPESTCWAAWVMLSASSKMITWHRGHGSHGGTGSLQASKIRRWSATFLYQNHSGRDEKQTSEMFRNSKTPWDCNMMASQDILSSNMEQLSTGYTNSAETWDWHLQAPSSGSSWSQKRPWRQW